MVTGVPVSRGAAPPPDDPFDVFTPLRRSEPGGESGGTAVPGGSVNAPYAGPYPGYGDTSPAPSSYTEGNDPGRGGDYAGGEAASGVAEDYKGLPRRVRQANLAPQLRSSAAAGPDGPTGVPRASAASLSDMRNTLSAMQRGWQQGRAQSQQDSEDGVDGD